MSEEKIWTVTEVNSTLRTVIEGSFAPFWMLGEVGDIKSRGQHVYLTLKDDKCEIPTVYFGGADVVSSLKIVSGIQVEVFGRLSVYEQRGTCQFYVKIMRPKGFGSLFLKFEELKKKLKAEGLFDTARKKKIPILPRRIGIVTSPEGAAIKDFLQIIARRFPKIHVRIYPCAVQGKGAEKQIASGVHFFNREKCVDVIIVMRGGGSMEDLWPFNEEVLAREISQSKIPVISAVGHEVDYTISDMVADMRVPTPSASAELVVAKQDEFLNFINDIRRRMSISADLSFERIKARFQNASTSYVFREPVHIVENLRQRLDELLSRAEKSANFAVERISLKIKNLYGKLNALDPHSVLQRGYSILIEKKTGKIILESGLPPGTNVEAILSKGKMELEVSGRT